ncbi:protein kinase domain-containing protein [Allocoleopsis franciscana]|uniref:WD40 repeat-containing protein n=1 Tax=Allocoleopsis franciscana PCC 7113 TaxID=1173027 RepID=K9WPT4_9CYAN|nr:protein kinase [Allocoleopsis franciscana]AFZ21799.1 WD40 repeat-containing protein [Allocoleopsis franciscana PCC 7113]
MLGITLSGRYTIVKHLGGGGFGQTYLAEDLQLPGNPICVVKQLQPRSTNPLALKIAKRLFDREAQVLYKLGNHDQIPRLLAHFEQKQEFYLVQEFIEGHDLKQELQLGKRLSETQVIAICQELLNILEFVHQQDVIHRDIKPANIIRRKHDGKLVLIDFGAVKEVTNHSVNSEGHSSLTVAIGSPGYMPNEQLRGKPQFCSDIYAVGMLGIQGLTGVLPSQLPEDPKTLEIIWRDQWHPNKLPQQVQTNSELADVLDQMVRYDYRQRYQTATDALQAFQGLTNAYSSSTTAAASEYPLPEAADPFESTVTYPRPAQVPGSPLNSTMEAADPFESTVTYPRPAQVPSSPLNSTIEADEPTQAPPSQQLPTPDVSATLLETQVSNETTEPLVSQSRKKSSRLMAMGAGIVTALALAVGISHVQQNNAKTPENGNVEQKVSQVEPAKQKSQGSESQAESANSLAPLEKGLQSASEISPRPPISASPPVLRNTSNAWNNSEKIALANTLMGHSQRVSSIAISSDGQLIASGSEDKTIKVWNLGTGQLLRTLTGHSEGIRSAAISPDGKWLASGGDDKTIKLWNLDTGKLLRTLTGHSDIVQSVTISPDGKLIASGSNDKTVKLWNLETGQEIRTLTGFSYFVVSVAISPDGQTLVSGADKIYLWHLPTGNLISTISDPSGNVIPSLAMTPDGETLVSGSNWGKFSLWNLRNLLKGCKGVQPCRPTQIVSGSNGGWVQSLAISPDGKTLATGSDRENTIKLWNASTGEPRITISNRSTSVESLAFSPDGKTLVTNGEDGKIELWR